MFVERGQAVFQRTGQWWWAIRFCSRFVCYQDEKNVSFAFFCSLHLPLVIFGIEAGIF